MRKSGVDHESTPLFEFFTDSLNRSATHLVTGHEFSELLSLRLAWLSSGSRWSFAGSVQRTSCRLTSIGHVGRRF